MIHLREQKELIEAALAGDLPHLVQATTPGARKTRGPDGEARAQAKTTVG